MRYAFFTPILPGKVDTWKKYVKEMTGKKKAAWLARQKRIGFKQERAWLQQTPMGDFAVVLLEAKDIQKVFEQFLTSKHPFDVWFREKILMEVHGLDPAAPPPPMNELVLDFPSSR